MLDRFHNSAEAFSPVLYLRGSESVLFDFRLQRHHPAAASAPPFHGPTRRPPPCTSCLRQPFTLVLGDRWKDERGVMDGFCERLRQALLKEVRRHPRRTLPELPRAAL